MSVTLVFAALSVTFLALGFVRSLGGRAAARLQSRIWLLIGAIFGVVSAFLFLQGS